VSPQVGLQTFGSPAPTYCVVRRPETFGARRDVREVQDAAMTNASAVLTSASGPFSASDVGKAINVRSAGVVAGDTLSTTIASYQSPTQVTLAAVANATVSSKQALWGTDDTAAIGAALASAYDACVADRSYYCEVQFTAGTYALAAPTTKGGAARGNAQVSIPVRDPADGPKVTIVLRGLTDAGAWGHWQQVVGQRSGAVLRSMVVGQEPDATWKSPSVVGATTVDLTSGSFFSNVRVVVDGITVAAPYNPSVIAMDLRRCAQADVPRFSALADAAPFELNDSATDDNGIGLYMPSQNNNDSCNIGVYGCEGFYYGLGASDHLTAQRVGCIYCNTAIVLVDTITIPAHGSSILYASVEATPTAIEFIGGSGGLKFPLVVHQMNTEGVTTAVKDSGNFLRGYVGWTANEDADPVVVGAAHIKVENLYRARGAISAPAVPASTVAATPIFRDAAVTISGGTVTAITVDGTAAGVTSGTVVVPCGKTIALTYSVAPTWRWVLY